MHTTIVLFHQLESNPGDYRLVLRSDLTPTIEKKTFDRKNEPAWVDFSYSGFDEVEIVTAALEFLAHRDYSPVMRTVIVTAPSPGLTEINLGRMEFQE